MEHITDEMLLSSLRYIQEQGGKISRYSFDKYLTKHIKVQESFIRIPRMLLDEKLIEIHREDNSTIISITSIGQKKLTAK